MSKTLAFEQHRAYFFSKPVRYARKANGLALLVILARLLASVTQFIAKDALGPQHKDI